MLFSIDIPGIARLTAISAEAWRARFAGVAFVVPLLSVSALAACAPPTAGGATGSGAGGSPGTGITVFGDARLGVLYAPDEPGGKPRARTVAE